MERYWTKRTLAALAKGEPELVELWQSQFGRFLYTGFYYQWNKDADAAARLTAATLTAALRSLAAFAPEQTTMYLWLKSVGAAQIQEAMSQSSAKPQRPWAWAELPGDIQDALQRLRNEPLPAFISENAAVMEMVQAALAELSQQDRDLLVRRYTRLDTAERIAAEMKTPLEQLHQLLHSARHSFRRTLFGLVQSVCTEFAEPIVTGGTELLEDNLELLLRSITPAVISAEHTEQIRTAVRQAAAELAAQAPAAKSFAKRRWMPVAAVAAVIALIAAVGLWRSRPAPQQTPPAATAAAQPSEPTAAAAPSNAEEELKRAMQAGARGDMAALLEILQRGAYMAQVTAALYLGQIGDEKAIAPLLAAQQRWYPNGIEDNPFGRAVAAIEDRIAPAPAAPQPTPPPAAPTAAPKPLLTGRVLDYDGTPLAGVLVSAQPLATGLAAGAAAAAVSDAQGHYKMDAIGQGLWVVGVKDAKRRIADGWRLAALRSDQPTRLDWGGAVTVGGSVVIDGLPLAEQTLLLSDRFAQPAKGVFCAQTQTDGRGAFLFSGVPDGLYGLFARIAANRWTLLAQAAVKGQDVLLTPAVSTATITVRAAATDAAAPLGAWLRDEPDSGDATAQWPGVKMQDAGAFAIKGVPTGVYTLCVDYTNGVRLMRPLAVEGAAPQEVVIEPPPGGPAALRGRLLAAGRYELTLSCAEPPLRIALAADEQGRFAVENIPAATYTAGLTVNGQFAALLEIGVFDAQSPPLEMNVAELLKTRAPLTVFAADAAGRGLSGGQVWLSGDAGLFVAAPYERGFFAVVPPGRYTLHAVFDGHAPYECPANVPAAALDAPPTQENTLTIFLP